MRSSRALAAATGKSGEGGVSTKPWSSWRALALWGSIYPASRSRSSLTRRTDFSMARIRRYRPSWFVWSASWRAILSWAALFPAIALAWATTPGSFFCWGGYSVGTMEMAPLGQASAHRPQPRHFSTLMTLFSVSVAPVGQTYRQRQSFVHNRRLRTAICFMVQSLPSTCSNFHAGTLQTGQSWGALSPT